MLQRNVGMRCRSCLHYTGRASAIAALEAVRTEFAERVNLEARRDRVTELKNRTGAYEASEMRERIAVEERVGAREVRVVP